MSDQRKPCAAVIRCVMLMALIGVSAFLLWLIFKPNTTNVDEVSSKMVEENSFINLDPSLEVDVHGNSCWITIGVLATLIILMLTAIAIFPRWKARREKKKAQKQEIALQLDTLAEQSEDQKLAAVQEIASLREASNQRLQSLNAEVFRLCGETNAVVAHQSSRDRINP